MDKYTRTYQGQSYRVVSTLSLQGQELFQIQEPVTVRYWFQKRTEWVTVGINPTNGFRTRRILPYAGGTISLPFYPIQRTSLEKAEEKYREIIDSEQRFREAKKAQKAYGTKVVPR